MSTEMELYKDGANRVDFLKGVETQFPESFAKIQDIGDELIHLNMADFARTTSDAIRSGQTELVVEHFKFISKLFSRAIPELENAIYVSYLENIFLGELDDVVISSRLLLPENLAMALVDLEEHLESLKR